VNKNNIISGVVLIFIGIFLLLFNLDLIRWSIIDVLLDLWPLILIAVGFSIVFNSKKAIKTIIWICFFVIIITYGFYQQYINYGLPFIHNSNINTNVNSNDNNNNSNINSSNTDANISYELDNKVKKATLDLTLSAADLEITPSFSSTNLLEGYIENPRIDKKIDYFDSGQQAKIIFKEKTKKINIGETKDYKASLHLSKDIFWNIEGDIGAVSGNMDLRDIRVNDIDLDFGAGDIKILLGNNVENLNVDIDAGATNITITVPEELGVRIKLDGGLKQSNLKSLGWKVVNDWYTSPNYESSLSKVSIEIDMGVGSFNLNIENSNRVTL